MSLATLRDQYAAVTAELRSVVEGFVAEVAAAVTRAKRDLEQRGRRYDELGEKLSDAIWAADPAGDDGNGHFYELRDSSQAALNALEESSRPSEDDLQAVADAVAELKRTVRQWSKDTEARLRRIREVGR